jgi:hypothetical protein
MFGTSKRTECTVNETEGTHQAKIVPGTNFGRSGNVTQPESTRASPRLQTAPHGHHAFHALIKYTTICFDHGTLHHSVRRIPDIRLNSARPCPIGHRIPKMRSQTSRWISDSGTLRLSALGEWVLNRNDGEAGGIQSLSSGNHRDLRPVRRCPILYRWPCILTQDPDHVPF